MKNKLFKWYMNNSTYCVEIWVMLFAGVYSSMYLGSSPKITVGVVISKFVVGGFISLLIFMIATIIRVYWVAKQFKKIKGTWKLRAMPSENYIIKTFWIWDINKYTNWVFDHDHFDNYGSTVTRFNFYPH